jgi:hypothetical protein
MQAGNYVTALAGGLPRRNGWTIAQQAGDRTPQRTQRLLSRAVWDTFAAMGVVRAFAVAGLDEAAGRAGRGLGELASPPPSPRPLVPPAHPPHPEHRDFARVGLTANVRESGPHCGTRTVADVRRK